jgi:hypothetical protein
MLQYAKRYVQYAQRRASPIEVVHTALFMDKCFDSRPYSVATSYRRVIAPTPTLRNHHMHALLTTSCAKINIRLELSTGYSLESLIYCLRLQPTTVGGVEIVDSLRLDTRQTVHVDICWPQFCLWAHLTRWLGRAAAGCTQKSCPLSRGQSPSHTADRRRQTIVAMASGFSKVWQLQLGKPQVVRAMPMIARAGHGILRMYRHGLVIVYRRTLSCHDMV